MRKMTSKAGSKGPEPGECAKCGIEDCSGMVEAKVVLKASAEGQVSTKELLALGAGRSHSRPLVRRHRTMGSQNPRAGSGRAEFIDEGELISKDMGPEERVSDEMMRDFNVVKT